MRTLHSCDASTTTETVDDKPGLSSEEWLITENKPEDNALLIYTNRKRARIQSGAHVATTGRGAPQSEPGSRTGNSL